MVQRSRSAFTRQMWRETKEGKAMTLKEFYRKENISPGKRTKMLQAKPEGGGGSDGMVTGRFFGRSVNWHLATK